MCSHARNWVTRPHIYRRVDGDIDEIAHSAYMAQNTKQVLLDRRRHTVAGNAEDVCILSASSPLSIEHP